MDSKNLRYEQFMERLLAFETALQLTRCAAGPGLWSAEQIRNLRKNEARAWWFMDLGDGKTPIDNWEEFISKCTFVPFDDTAT